VIHSYQNVAAQSDELAALNQRMAALEGRMSTLEQSVQRQQQSVGNWTLWFVSEALNAGYPQALSAYSSKSDCLNASRNWVGGKLVAEDPAIFQFKGYRVRYECLPVGTTPYAH
jgi:type II secretory pathway component PulJ